MITIVLRRCLGNIVIVVCAHTSLDAIMLTVAHRFSNKVSNYHEALPYAVPVVIERVGTLPFAEDVEVC